MGGDGGVIASNRKYMRGAGAADHTADLQRQNGNQQVVVDVMNTCAISNEPLDWEQHAIVACPYGRLYHKEAAVEALLRKKGELGDHIRGLKDLYNVRPQLEKKQPVCPITGGELTGQIPALLLVPGKEGETNLISERAMKEMGKEALQTEYGPFQDTVRLAPPESLLEQIKEKLQEKRKSKKRKRNDKKKESKEVRKHPKDDNVATAARSRVAAAVQKNSVLSSLFAVKKDVSEKEAKDNLFAR